MKKWKGTETQEQVQENKKAVECRKQTDGQNGE
jgi:hypothetical protein